jgi:hypothetical protein
MGRHGDGCFPILWGYFKNRKMRNFIFWGQIKRIFDEKVAGPWIEMETAARGTFHKKIAIKDLVGVVQKSPLLPIFDTGGEISCFCGD